MKLYIFEIEFPIEPEITKDKVQTEIGELTNNLFVLDGKKAVNDLNYMYILNTIIYPNKDISSEKVVELNDFFDNTIIGAASTMNGSPSKAKQIYYGAYPGRECVIAFNQNKGSIVMKLFLIENQMYVLQVVTPTKDLRNEASNDFFSSFKVLD